MNIKCIFKHNFILIERYFCLSIIGEKYICQRCNKITHNVYFDSMEFTKKNEYTSSTINSYVYYKNLNITKLDNSLLITNKIMLRKHNINNILCK